MKRRHFILGALIAGTAQSAALGKIIFDRANFLKNGQEVVLETGFIDPRDLFRGHYVSLQLNVSQIDSTTVTVAEDIDFGDTVYLELQQGDGVFAVGKSLTRKYPQAPTGPVLRGTARARFRLFGGKNKSIRVEFPFDRYFAPKLRAQELEKLRRDQKLGVILALDDTGAGAIKGITINGKKIYEEPLF